LIDLADEALEGCPGYVDNITIKKFQYKMDHHQNQFDNIAKDVEQLLVRKNVFTDRNNSVNYDINKLFGSSKKEAKVDHVDYINLLKIVKLIDRILFNT
jgi:hypothetical protein